MAKPTSRRMRNTVAVRFMVFMRQHYEHLEVVLDNESVPEWTIVIGGPKVMELAHAYQTAAESFGGSLAQNGENKVGYIKFCRDGCVLLNESYIEPPSLEDPAIRRCDIYDNIEERSPGQDGYEEWADLFNFRQTILQEIAKPRRFGK